MIALLLWEHIVRRIAVIKDGILLELLGRYHHYRGQSSEQVNLVYDKYLG